MSAGETSYRGDNLSTGVASLIFQRSKEIRKEHTDEIRRLIFDEKLNFQEIAERIIPDEYKINVSIASEMIRKAAKKILGNLQYKKVTHRNQVEAGKKNKGKTAQAFASLSAQGIPPWSHEERERLKVLMSMSEYQYQEGWNAGMPIREKIAFAINLEFYDKRPSRSRDAIGTEITNLLREKGHELTKRIAWEKVDPVLQQLLQQAAYRYSGTARFGRSGKPNFKKIAATLCKLFPDQPVIKGHNISSYLRSRKEMLVENLTPDKT